MFKFVVIPLLILLASCSDYLSRHDADDTGYFSDASDCFRSSARKEAIKVPTARTMTVIDIPLGNDAGVFGQCMEQAGHPATKIDAEEYLKTSHACMKEARESTSPDAAYAQCVRRGKIAVEIIGPDRPK